ncbi:uncharacterized protein LOC132622875 [Lycium barbarum]|uniref:uncharacterized protein LOC132622875 n=1 Tax=Lycium barbarum TaxID=112863 RepID=UPI00293E12EB|nr:uncharacterized protein LOC132622875 [Lycium barbarum]
MDGYPASPVVVARNKSTPSRTATITAVKNHRHVAAVDDDDDGDPIECTGKSCKSCTGGVVADCVALCCCPCAVIDILALTFLKIPYMMGRKYLVKGKKKLSSKKKLEKQKKKMKKKEEMEKSYSYRDCVTYELDSTDGRISTRSVKVEDEEKEKERTKLGIELIGEEVLKDNNVISASFDAEEFWLELYEQVGHLGFGRVSFTGIPSQGSQNFNCG